MIWVEPLTISTTVTNRGRGQTEPLYGLRQAPDVDGGFVADPKTGAFAMVGGWESAANGFNCVTQAWRQEWSATAAVYVTAMEGIHLDSVVDDSPIELPQGPGLPMWKPANYEGTSGGPSTLRDALIHSKNLVTARLATMIGMPSIAQTVQSFDVMEKMPLYYSMALGAGETTLLRLTNAYGMLDNKEDIAVDDRHGAGPGRQDRLSEGRRVVRGAMSASRHRARPTRIQARPDALDPKTAGVSNAEFAANTVVYKPTRPDPLVTPEADYYILSMMQGVVQGTGIEVAAVGKPLAGKTGTTNDFKDAWFVGFSPNLTAGGFVGFDNPRTLGNNETGGHVAAPIFRDFMEAALKNAPPTPFPGPPADMAPAVANNNQSQQPQQNYGSTQPGSDVDQARCGRNRRPAAEPMPTTTRARDRARTMPTLAAGIVTISTGKAISGTRREPKMATNPPIRIPPTRRDIGIRTRRRPRRQPSGRTSPDSQGHRADDRPTRASRTQRTYADQNDDPNAPARYRRYVPYMPPAMCPYGRAVPGPMGPR